MESQGLHGNISKVFGKLAWCEDAFSKVKRKKRGRSGAALSICPLRYRESRPVKRMSI